MTGESPVGFTGKFIESLYIHFIRLGFFCGLFIYFLFIYYQFYHLATS